MFLGFLKDKRVLLPLVLLSVAAVFVANLLEWNRPQEYAAMYNNMIRIDNFAVAFTGIVLLSALLILPFSQRFGKLNDAHTGEYYALMLFSLVGVAMMVSFNNLLMLFIGIEIMSIIMYVLAGSDKDNKLSNEASIKYFLMGAFATGILLFGIALIYGATGSFYLTGIGTAAAAMHDSFNYMLGIGILMVLIGLAFKLGAAPFHFWTPDVYEGTPTIFTTFMATVVKTAGIAAFARLFFGAFSDSFNFWQPAMIGITVLTLLIGNLAAVYQLSFKRMMAYSSISHAGYLMLALTSFNGRSENAILFYSLSYAVATIGAFGVLMLVSNARKSEAFDAFNGLGRTNPLLAFVMTVSMCSLAGIPLTGGFFGKLFVFGAALDAGLLWLVVIAIIMAGVGIFYYFRVVIAMYMKDPAGDEVPVSGTYRTVLVLTAILTIALGVAPGLVGFLI